MDNQNLSIEIGALEVSFCNESQGRHLIFLLRVISQNGTLSFSTVERVARETNPGKTSVEEKGVDYDQ